MSLESLKQYSFEKFLSVRDSLNYLDSPFLLTILDDFLDGGVHIQSEEMKAFSNKVSEEWRELTEINARVENHPSIRHYDAYNNRIDEIIRPYEMKKIEKEVFSIGLFSSSSAPQVQAIKRFLLHQNGEAGIMCPIACTDGLIALLEKFEDELSPELNQILLHTKEGIDGEFGIGAQYMSEIQGGSNIPINVLEAVPENDHYRLYGNKFFCSAVHADYSVVTARVKGKDYVSTFIVPSWMTKEDKKKNRRNGHMLNRLKRKLGTCELPSAEITYEGAIAYPVGPLEKGVSLAVGIVLTRSRLDIAFGSAGFLMKAAREAILYARFRGVFDRKIDEFPMAKAQLLSLEDSAKRTTATAFHIYKKFIENEKRFLETDKFTKEQFVLRELILLQKIFASEETVNQLRVAISLFGGHGAIEDFSSIPRLYRDAMVNELWEGPKNVLLAQIYRDFKRNQKLISPDEFIEALLPSTDLKKRDGYVKAMMHLFQGDLFGEATIEAIDNAKKWEELCREIFRAYQSEVMKRFNDVPILSKEAFDLLQ